MATKTLVKDFEITEDLPGRPAKTEENVLSSETTTLAIDKRRMGLVGITWPAIASTFTFTVSHDNSTFRALANIAAVDTTVAGARSFSELAEWPFFKIVFAGSVSGTIGVVMS